MKIETERLILRKWTLNDVSAQVEGLNNFETSKNLTVPFPYTEENSILYITRHFEEDDDFAFAIELKESGKVIGGASLHIKNDVGDGGIWLNEKYTGMGYGTETWVARAKLAFEAFGLNNLNNGFFEFNNRSRHMHEKIGYKIVGQSMRFCPALNKEVVEILTNLSRDDFYEKINSTKLKSVYDKVKIDL